MAQVPSLALTILLLFSVWAVYGLKNGGGDISSRLRDWIESNGGYISDKVVVQDKNGIRGVFAKQYIKVNEPLFEIPHSCMLTEIEAENYLAETYQLLLRAEPCKKLDRGFSAEIIAFLAIERHNRRSDFRVYIDSLPTTCEGIAACLSEDDMRWVSDDEVFSGVSHYRMVQSCLRTIHDELHNTASTPRLRRKFAAVTVQDLQWAYSMLESRAWHEEQLCTREFNGCGKLIPYADMLNHRGSTAHFNPDSGHYRTKRTFHPGQELLWTYGSKSAWDFLVNYGFVPDDLLLSREALSKSNLTSSDFYGMTVEYDLNRWNPLSSAKFSLLMNLGYGRDTRASGDGGSSVSVVSVFESLRYHPEFDASSTATAAAASSPTSPATSISFLAATAAAVPRRLLRFLRIANADWSELGRFIDSESGELLGNYEELEDDDEEDDDEGDEEQKKPSSAAADLGHSRVSLRNEWMALTNLIDILEDNIQTSWSSTRTRGTWQEDLALALPSLNDVSDHSAAGHDATPLNPSPVSSADTDLPLSSRRSLSSVKSKQQPQPPLSASHNPPTTPVQRTAVHVRAGLKRIMQQCVEACKRALTSLAREVEELSHHRRTNDANGDDLTHALNLIRERGNAYGVKASPAPALSASPAVAAASPSRSRNDVDLCGAPSFFV